ncbi:hypothetical protein N0B44_20900 [Roseibacterium beibuensis]|uniref:hypothetical protein n=1 Tax=[Roseibacterium] beibuensis TaxID=1193142 RepID=UPI00217D677C|nr:hypothetical protein [Roseibacterium beibuensis]MCS6625373.1 hypothetical protein [Roseibacterium beibuensis]
MADETDTGQTVDEVIVGFQKALGRAWKASEEAMKADPGIAGGTRQLFGVSQLDIELACTIEARAGASDKLEVRLNPPAGVPASVLRFRVESKPINVSEASILTLSRASPRAEDDADVVLLANLLDPRSEGIPRRTVQFELSRPGLERPLAVRRVTTDVRGQAALPVTIDDLEPEAGERLSARANRLAEADPKVRLLARASVNGVKGADGAPLRTEWAEFSIERSAVSSSGPPPDDRYRGDVIEIVTES